MPVITTPFGVLETLPDIEFFPDGTVQSCIADRVCPLITPLGMLVPQFTANTLRKRQLPAISFHPNGMIRNLPLEEQILVCTPVGVLPAEQVSFYESGALKRIFPLNGTLSGYWTQEDEARLATPLTLETPLGPVETLAISLYFSPSGALRSLTLWPGTTLDVPTPLGGIAARVGVSFFDSGVLRSLEPAEPVSVATPVGELLAYDPDAIGICGDNNSLRFRENGSLCGLTSAAHSFDVVLENGRVRRLTPPLLRHPCDGERMEASPLCLEFRPGVVSISSAVLSRLSAAVESVTPSRFFLPLPSLSPMCSMGAGKW
jgi:hypothetical protein